MVRVNNVQHWNSSLSKRNETTNSSVSNLPTRRNELSKKRNRDRFHSTTPPFVRLIERTLSLKIVEQALETTSTQFNELKSLVEALKIENQQYQVWGSERERLLFIETRFIFLFNNDRKPSTEWKKNTNTKWLNFSSAKKKPRNRYERNLRFVLFLFWTTTKGRHLGTNVSRMDGHHGATSQQSTSHQWRTAGFNSDHWTNWRLSSYFLYSTKNWFQDDSQMASNRRFDNNNSRK